MEEKRVLEGQPVCGAWSSWNMDPLTIKGGSRREVHLSLPAPHTRPRSRTSLGFGVL